MIFILETLWSDTDDITQISKNDYSSVHCYHEQKDVVIKRADFYQINTDYGKSYNCIVQDWFIVPLTASQRFGYLSARCVSYHETNKFLWCFISPLARIVEDNR